LPIIGGNEIAARVTTVGRIELLDEIDNVLPEAVRVCCRMPWLVYAAVNGSPEVLKERTVKSGINARDPKIAMNNNIRFQRTLP